MANPFVHIELHTQDPEKAKSFYSKLFDWTLEDYLDMNYTIIQVGEGNRWWYDEEPHARCSAAMGALYPRRRYCRFDGKG